MQYDLSTKEGICKFIDGEFNFDRYKFVDGKLHVKGLISNLYQRNREAYQVLGMDLEDLFQEAYIWMYEKIEKKKDMKDTEYLKKLVSLEIKNRMSNLLNRSRIEQKRFLNHKIGNGNSEEYLEHLLKNTGNNVIVEDEDRIDWEKVNEIVGKVNSKLLFEFFSGKSYREISKILKKEDISLCYQAISNRIPKILKVLKKNMKNMLTKRLLGI